MTRSNLSFARQAVWLTLLVGAFWAIVARDTATVGREVAELSGIEDVVASLPEVSRDSPTGYAGGLRKTILGGHDDGYQWIMQAELAAESGDWRVRSVVYDNAPEGREVHWAMPHRLWLLGTGWAIHVGTGVSLGEGIERAAICEGPLFFALFGAAFILVVARSYSLTAATMAAFGLAGLPLLRAYFDPAEADHHGLIAATVLAMVFSLHRGLQLEGSGGSSGAAARRWLAGAGVAGGLGLWMSAATLLPALVAIGGGAALWCVVTPPGPRRGQIAVGLRYWGRAGAIVSAITYLIEYFPSHLGLRLEVNHPLYALAWAGAAELLACRAESGAVRRSRRAWTIRVAGASAAAGALPVVFMLTWHDAYWVADPLVWHIHREYILEFQPIWRSLGGEMTRDVLCTAVAAVGLIGLGFFRWRRQLAPGAGSRWLMTAAPALVFGLMAALQIRWGGMFSAALLVVLIAATADCAGHAAGPRARWWRAWPLALLLPGVLCAAVELWTPPRAIGRGEMLSLAERSLAYRLRQRIGNPDDAVILTTPHLTNTMAYFGGLHGIGSLYWENRPGLYKAAEIDAAPTMDLAHALVRRWGITHLVVASWDGFEPQYVRLARGRARSDPVPADAFIMQLIDGHRVPPWLRPVAYRLPDHPAFAGERVRIFEVVPDQPPDLAAVDAVESAIESGAFAEAVAGKAQLEKFPDSVPALVTLCRLEGTARAIGEILPQVARIEWVAAPMRLEDRIRLASLLAQGGDEALARRQLARCYEQLGDRALRRLSPNAMATLRKLADGLELPFPDAALHRLAVSLTPPYLR